MVPAEIRLNHRFVSFRSGLVVTAQNIHYLMCHQFFDIGSSGFQIFPGVKG